MHIAHTWKPLFMMRFLCCCCCCAGLLSPLHFYTPSDLSSSWWLSYQCAHENPGRRRHSIARNYPRHVVPIEITRQVQIKCGHVRDDDDDGDGDDDGNQAIRDDDVGWMAGWMDGWCSVLIDCWSTLVCVCVKGCDFGHKIDADFSANHSKTRGLWECLRILLRVITLCSIEAVISNWMVIFFVVGVGLIFQCWCWIDETRGIDT